MNCSSSKKVTICILILFCMGPLPQVQGRQIETVLGADLDGRDLSSEEIQAIERVLLEFSKQPINLNLVTREILEQVPLLAGSDIDALLDFLGSNETISTWSEVEAIPGLSLEAITILRVVGSVEGANPSPAAHPPAWIQIRTLIKGKWDSSKSPPENGGSRYRRSVRIDGRVRNLIWGLTLQNDPYEQFRWDPGGGWYGFDHISGYVTWGSDDSPLIVTIGNFTVDAGQGLVHTRPFGTRLSAASPSQIVRSWSGLRRYSGSSPLSLRGIGVSVQIMPALKLQTFFSQKSLDARVDSSAVGPDPFFVLSGSTTHISDAQLLRRQTLSSSVLGILIDGQMGPIRLGIQVSKNSFHRPVQQQDGELARTRFMAASLYGVANLSAFRFTGEVTAGGGKPSQFVLGSTWKPTRSVRLFSHLYRYDALSMYRFGNPFGFKRSLNSQKGITVGATFKPGKNWNFSASLNYYAGVSSKEVVFFSNTFSDLRLHLQGKLSPASTMKILLRSKRAQKLNNIELPSGSEIGGSDVDRLWQASLLMTHSISKRLVLASRFDTNLASTSFNQSSSGIHMFQQISLNPSSQLSLVFRHSLFSAPESENRFYIYEPDVRGQLSVPVLSTEGSRSMILLTFTPTSHWRFQVKWTEMHQALVDLGTSALADGVVESHSGPISERLSVRHVQLLSLQLAVEL